MIQKSIKLLFGKIKYQKVRAKFPESNIVDQYRGSSINHVDTKGGGGVSQMSTFVYVGGGGSWLNVYVDNKFPILLQSLFQGLKYR